MRVRGLLPFLLFGTIGHAGDRFGFDTQQGFLPNDSPGCRVEVHVSQPFYDGMMLELNERDTATCGDISKWRVTEYEEDKYFAAAYIPLPEPLVLKWERRGETPLAYNRIQVDDECTTVSPREAPIQDAHEVLKTEECAQKIHDSYPEEVTYRGIKTGHLITHRTNYRAMSRFTRWLVKIDDSESALGYTLVVVEEFEPVHGNARWHTQLYDDVSEDSCPPGDWRDIMASDDEVFDNHTFEEWHRRAANADYRGEPPVLKGGMRVIPTNGATRIEVNPTRCSFEGCQGSREIPDAADGDQVHRVTPLSRTRCVATARMVLSDDPNDEHVKALGRRMDEDDAIGIAYTPLWRHRPVWWKREPEFGPMPEVATYAPPFNADFLHREDNQPGGTVEVESKCPPVEPCPICPETPSRPEREPSRSRNSRTRSP